MNDKQLVIQKKCEFFHKGKIAVHIKKENGYFHNGLILEVQGDLLIIDDRKNGAMPIYFMEIKEVEKMEESK